MRLEPRPSWVGSLPESSLSGIRRFGEQAERLCAALARCPNPGSLPLGSISTNG
jgi:hypothetical protein